MSSLHLKHPLGSGARRALTVSPPTSYSTLRFSILAHKS